MSYNKEQEEETTNCNQCEEEILLAEAEYHSGLCCSCYADAYRAMMYSPSWKSYDPF